MFNGLFPGQPWQAGTMTNILDSTEARDDEVAVVPTGPYASQLHLTPDRQPCQHLMTQVFTGWMLFLPPNQQCQSTDGN